MKKNAICVNHLDEIFQKKIFLRIPALTRILVLTALIFFTSAFAGYSNNEGEVTVPANAATAEIQQEQVVTGTVTDSQGVPLPGVTVLIKGTTRGAITDSDGNFRLDVPAGADILVFSFVGMRTLEIPVEGRRSIDVVLEPEVFGIDEVVAIGYGTMRKADLTGSVSSIASDELMAVKSYRTENLLKGRASGVTVKQNSGDPTSRIEVRIRGANSMVGGNDPLYVVDGVPLAGGIEFISPSDIESIDILKDASSTAIYGSRGANGVVIVTTKSGIKGQKDKIEINSYYGVQKEVKRYEVLNAKQYATIANLWMVEKTGSPYFDLNDVEEQGTDWQDLIFQVAPIQEHAISFSGSTEKTSFFLSGSYFAQEGIIKNTGAQKGSLKLSMQHQLHERLTITEDVILTRRENQNTRVEGAYGKTALSGAMAASPTLPVYDDEGLPTLLEAAYPFSPVDSENPVLFLDPRKDKRIMDQLLANTKINYEITDGLSIQSMAGYEYYYGIREYFIPIIYSFDKGYTSEEYAYTRSFVNENTINYKKTFAGKHSVNLVGGLTYQDHTSRSLGISVEDLASNITENYDLSGAAVINNPSNGISQWALLSWLGRANYSFDNKYLFTASFRADGSSRFGESNKWGFFPSGAIAWRVTEEDFMDAIPQINYLKLRASYGLTGNTALSPYQTLSRLGSVKYDNNGSEVTGWAPVGISNTGLKWETTAQMDVGFDMNLFNDLLIINFDYYDKITSDLLAAVPLPPSSGYTSTLDNIGKIRNSGIELSVNMAIIGPGNDFRWNLTGNISANRNKVLELAGGSEITSGSLDIPFYSSSNIIREGEPFGMLYGYIEDGLNEEGRIQFLDTNNDTIVNAADRVIIGNPYPDFIYSIVSDFSYKNFDLSIFIEGSQGNDLFWATAGTHLNSFQRGHNQFKDLWGNYWTPENPDPNAKYPKISDQSNFDVSDRFVKDGSYLRVKTVSLGYSIPTTKLGMSWCSKARFYIIGTNLLTFTKYPGLDPDVNNYGSDTSSAANRARLGIDEGAYPSARSVSLGLNLSF